MKTYTELRRDLVLTDIAIDQWKEYVYNPYGVRTIHECVFCKAYPLCSRCPIVDYASGTCSPATPWLTTSIATQDITIKSKVADNQMLVLLYKIRANIVNNLINSDK